MMKNAVWFILLSIICLLTGCGNETEKMCRIEIQSVDNTCITALEQQTQADIVNFFDEEHWIECEGTDEDLVPEYTINLYQEKTHTLIQEEKEDAYEKIMEYTIYKDSDIVKMTISQAAIKSGLISEDNLTMYYIGSKNFFTSISQELSDFIP